MYNAVVLLSFPSDVRCENAIQCIVVVFCYFGFERIAGGWGLGSNYLQAFVNSQKEWGMAYKVKVSDTASLNLGVSSFLNNEQRMATQFGYKLQV